MTTAGNPLPTVAVLGAGTMGSGIAQVFAAAGHQVAVFDIQAEALTRAMKNISRNLAQAREKGKLTAEQEQQTLQRISYTSELGTLVVDVVIEAVVERTDVKQKLFCELAAINPPQTILATNTSSIPITQIAAGVPNPERVVGVHFFNPAHIMKLVEIISGAQTDTAVAERMKAMVEKTGKVCVMAKDAPGFIVNRVARHYYVEGLKLLEEQVAAFEDIDALAEASGFKLGPFRLMDLIGVDTNFSVTSSMYALFHQDGKFRPSRIQQQKVDAGHWGKKTGKGFYTYE